MILSCLSNILFPKKFVIKLYRISEPQVLKMQTDYIINIPKTSHLKQNLKQSTLIILYEDKIKKFYSENCVIPTKGTVNIKYTVNDLSF